jgi:hypothetical protein
MPGISPPPAKISGSKSFGPTNGAEVSSLGSTSDGVSGVVIEGLPSIASDVLGSAAVGVESQTEISSVAPSLSTWKLNSPKAISKPPVLTETAPARLGAGSMVVAAGVRSVMLGDAVSMMVDLAMLTSFSGRITTQLGTPRGRYDEHSRKSFP